jgi:chemotaxis protein MotB
MEFPSPLPEVKPETLKVEDNKENDNPDFDLKEKAELAELQKKVNEYIKAKKLEAHLQTRLTDEGLLVTILNDVFFDSGKADVRISNKTLVQDISELLVTKPPRNVIISGHTDDVPIHNSQFDSNWHLSVMRAVNFMKVLLENPDLDPKRFSAKGFGEYQPVEANDSKEGRAKNRRVELLILPNEYTQQ